jgi:hypothetical protein
MTEYIEISPALDWPIYNPTAQQRAVYGFYERRNSDDASDIYSPEWFQRTKSFMERFAAPDVRTTVTTLKSWAVVEDLDFGAFFLAHPIAAFALWRLLQASYELDRAVCGGSGGDDGASAETQRELAAWQEMKPFPYLKSDAIRAKWSSALQRLKKEIECGALEGDALVRALYSILCGVERLENAFVALQDSFSVNLKNLIYMDKMLDEIRDAVDSRCRMIVDVLKLDENEDENALQSHRDGSNEGALGECF